MVMANLHIICGNCGRNDSIDWEYEKEEINDGEIVNDEDVRICCRNCGTLHSLNDNSPNVKKT